MLTQSSLQTLIDISNHEALRGYLTKVIIGTNFIPYYAELINYNDHDPDMDAQTWHKEQRLGQRYLMDQGLDTLMLTEALSNLPSCHEIEIRDSYSPSRYRGEETWTSYGITEYCKRYGLAKWRWWHNGELKHHVFTTVTRAMALTGKERQFTAFMMTTRLGTSELASEAFWQSPMVNLANAFKHCTTLMLPLHTHDTNPDSSYFLSFLRLFPVLDHLRLNGSPNVISKIWLAAAQKGVATSTIRRLDLGKMKTHSDDLKQFIASLKALEHLELHLVSDSPLLISETQHLSLDCESSSWH